MQLTLFEREVSKESLHGKLRTTIGNLLSEAQKVFDVVLIDCPPGLSVLTESWLREAEPASVADQAGLCLDLRSRGVPPLQGAEPGDGLCREPRCRHQHEGPLSPADEEYHRWLRENGDNRCFEQALPRSNAMQDAARFQSYERSYQAKYPGEIGHALRALSIEILDRMAASATATGAAPAPVAAVEKPAA